MDNENLIAQLTAERDAWRKCANAWMDAHNALDYWMTYDPSDMSPWAIAYDIAHRDAQELWEGILSPTAGKH